MPKVESDRNLLFGMIALSMDFITRDQLVGALHAWVLEKEKPLGEILRAQGLLREDDRRALENILNHQLARHGHDVEKSLAAIDPLGTARKELDAFTDHRLQLSVAAVQARPSKPDDPYVTRAEAVATTCASTRFRILRPHARGNLGEVFVAHDIDVDREVALKQIQERHADHADSRARFLVEAEVTGRLEHPSIVPVYALGHYSDGRPFYAMRLIHGESFKDAIARYHGKSIADHGEREVEFRNLLRRFLDVCNAIEYAHSRGVLHRDLKPGNVMLGKYGETLVVDWGLAKILGKSSPPVESDEPKLWVSSSDSAETLPGEVLGTPSYMSPEQAAGRLDRLGPASDVYSLGATLFCLLTGRPPFQGEYIGAILARVKLGEFPRPRSLNRRISPALDAICLKAMALRPEDRYASASALANDLERWLADERVSAWSEQWPRRALRWARRHRTMATAVVAACAVGLLLGSLGVYAYRRQVHQDEIQLEAAVARARHLRADARSAWVDRLDVSAWARAEDAAGTASALVKNRLPRSLRHEVTRLVRSISAEALAARSDASLLRMLTFVRAAAGDPQYDAVSGYQRVFESHGVRPFAESQLPASTRLAERPRAVAIRLASFLDHWAQLLAGEECDRARAARITALAQIIDPDPWRSELRAAFAMPETAKRLETLQRLAAAKETAEHPAITLTLLASGLRHAGDADSAVRLLEPARCAHGDDPWVFQELGLALRAVRPPRNHDALRAFTAAAALRPEMAYELAIGLRDTGSTVEAIEVLTTLSQRHPDAWYENRLGEMQAQVGRLSDANASFTRSIALSRVRLHESPDDAEAHFKLGSALYLAGDVKAAVASFRAAIRLKPTYAVAHNNLGAALRKAGDLTGALASYREAIRLAPDCAEARINLGNVLREFGKLPDAQAAYTDAIRLKPDSAMAHSNLATALREAGDAKAAAAACREAIRHKPDLAEAHNNLGNALRDLGDAKAAVASYKNALRLKPGLAEVHTNLGNALREAGDRHRAVASCREATRLRPNDPTAYLNLGAALRDVGDARAAADACRTAIRLAPHLAEAHNNLGNALRDLGDRKGAVSSYGESIRLKPGYVAAHINLGNVLRETGHVNDAVTSYREAVRLKPSDAIAHANLGAALREVGDLTAVVASCREAIRLNPNLAEAHNNLGAALRDSGDIRGALAAYREAIRIKPDYAVAHNNLGNALRETGNVTGAIASCRQAVALMPDLAEAHNNLGAALRDAGNLPEAVEAYRKAIQIKPDDAIPHNNLAAALRELGDAPASVNAAREAIRLRPDLAEAHKTLGASLGEAGDVPAAVAAYQEAIRLKADDAGAYINLGFLLQRQGRYAEAFHALRRGHELGSKRADWKYPSADWVKECQRLLTLASRLPAVLRGTDRPVNAAERIAFAQICTGKELYGAAARFWEDALREQPTLASDPRTGERYHAACAAAMAAAGLGRDEPPLSASARAGWRAKVRTWLEAELTAWAKLRETEKAIAGHPIIPALRHWKLDPELASIRDEAELRALSESERTAFRQLWAGVDTLLSHSSDDALVSKHGPPASSASAPRDERPDSPRGLNP